MVLGIQLAFRAFGVPDVEVQYEARIQRTRQHHAPAVSWRQLSLWTPKWHPPKKKPRWRASKRAHCTGGTWQRGTPIARLRLPAMPHNLRQHMPSSDEACRRIGLGDSLPCPWYGCRYHLGRDGAALVWPTIDPAAHECCALAVARRRARPPIQIAELLNCSVQLVEATYRSAVRKLRLALGDGEQDLGAAILRMRGVG